MTRQAVGAEFAGTGLLLYVVVGSGLAVGHLGTDAASGLFFHAVVVGLALAVLIVLFAAVSGAHFNPAVTLAMWRRGTTGGPLAVRYVIAQLLGAVAGVLLAHLSFSETAVSLATTPRTGWGPVVAELIGTLVLVLLILVLVDQDKGNWVGPVLGAWVAAMVFATSSTGFLNPAVTLARTLTDSYTGISPGSVPGFMAAQLLGGLVAVAVSSQLLSAQAVKGT